MKTRLALCTLAVVLAAPLSAQQPPLATGARVRVVPTDADGTWAVEGRLVRLRPDSVTIEPAHPPYRVRAFALDGSWRLEAAGPGHRHVGRRVLWGAGIGAVALGLLVGASYTPCTSQGPFSCMLAPSSPADAVLLGAAGGAIFGGGVGLVFGLLVRDAQWTPVRTEGIRVGATPLRAGRVGLGATVEF